MSAPGTIEQLRDPDLDPLLDGIRARYIPLFGNFIFASRNIPPGPPIGKAATKKFFRQFSTISKKICPFLGCSIHIESGRGRPEMPTAANAAAYLQLNRRRKAADLAAFFRHFSTK